MLTFTREQVRGAQIDELQTGEFFLWEEGRENVLALMLSPPQAGDSNRFVLNLSGETSFQLVELDVVCRTPVLWLRLESERVRLQVDPASATSAQDLQTHRPGRVVAVAGGGLAIAALPARPGSGRRSMVALLADWSVRHALHPAFGFDRWALAYETAPGRHDVIVSGGSAERRPAEHRLDL